MINGSKSFCSSMVWLMTLFLSDHDSFPITASPAGDPFNQTECFNHGTGKTHGIINRTATYLSVEVFNVQAVSADGVD